LRTPKGTCRSFRELRRFCEPVPLAAVIQNTGVPLF
jgi:hypothetical protein